MVESAEEFPTVIEHFSHWLHNFKEPIFCSWGNYDKKQLKKDCVFHSVKYPCGEKHINIKQKFSDNMGYKKGLDLEFALKSVNLIFRGTAHRGIDDARNIASLSNYVFGIEK